MFRRAFLATACAALFAASASAATIPYTAHLTGRGEVPKTTSKGKGNFRATLDTDTKQLTYTLTFEDLSGPATAAHIHGPASRTQTAGVLAPLGDKNPTSPISGTVTLTDDQVKELQNHKLYVNVHTAANPSGEIRGQIMAPHPGRRHHHSAGAAAASQEPAAKSDTGPAAGAQTSPDVQTPPNSSK